MANKDFYDRIADALEIISGDSSHIDDVDKNMDYYKRIAEALESIANAGGGSGGGALIVNINTDLETGVQTMDKTWQEIRNASFCVMKQAISADQVEQVAVVSTYYISKTPSAEEGKINYTVAITSGQGELVGFTADSPDGYPRQSGT